MIALNATDAAVRANLHLNLVNGNGATEGDRWATLSVVSTGPDHEGAINEPRSDALTPAVMGIAVLGLGAVLALLAVGLREPGEE